MSGVAVVVLCGAIVLGTKVRDRLDVERGSNRGPLSGIVASRQREAGGINLDAYYDEVEDILKAQYVEPIKDEQKLAIGAVRGMVSSLGDPHSQFMDKDAFAQFQAAQEGQFSGIGVDFYLQPNEVDLSAGDEVATDTDPTSDFAATRIPRLVVNSVIPGGPADKAGLKAGDWIDSVDGHWVIDAAVISHYRKLAATASQGKAPKELDDLRKELRNRAEGAIMPLRALTLLSLGTSGRVSVVVNRQGLAPLKVDVAKAGVLAPGNVSANGTIKLRFSRDAADFLKSAISGQRAVTIDLRSQPPGYFDSMMACLKVIAASGNYGVIATCRKGQHPTPFTISGGNPNPPRVTLIVDKSVRGAAAIFALALSSHAGAKLQGSEVSDDHTKTVVEGLSDGSGFTLVTGEYQPSAATTVPAKKVKA